jgi:hypothetical protein
MKKEVYQFRFDKKIKDDFQDKILDLKISGEYLKLGFIKFDMTELFEFFMWDFTQNPWRYKRERVKEDEE